MDSEESFRIFAASDLIVFPGRHSVYWEQAVAMAKPIIVKYWEGTTHVDIGGNCIFLYNDDEKEIVSHLSNLIDNPNVYQKLLNNAEKNIRKEFLYSEIAKRSLE